MMTKAELKEMLDSEPLWLLICFCQGDLSQEEINFLWNPRCNHTKNLATKQRRNPRTLQEIVEQEPKNLLLSMIRTEQWSRVGRNTQRREFWKGKRVPRPDEVWEDPFKFNPRSDLMESIVVYALDYRRHKSDGRKNGLSR